MLAVGSLALTGCGQKNQSNPNAGKGGGTTSKSAPLQDLNIKSRDEIKDGGTVRFSIDTLPTTWNALHIDGDTVDLGTTIMGFVGANNFDIAEDGTPKPDTDYLQSYDVQTNGGKQVVTLHLNPKARWNSGRTIDYTDYQATWKANNGANEDFKMASSDGFNQIESVEKGDKDTDVVITYKATYPDWTATWSSVMPKEGVGTPETFNNGWKQFKPEWFTGPFTLDRIDQAQKTLYLKRNPNWWGEKAKLDTVSFRAMDPATMSKAFANKEIDVVDDIITKDAYESARKRDDGELRQAGSTQWRHITFNAKSGPLQDKNVRQAIAKGLDRESIARSDLAGLPIDAASVMLGNHFFMPGQNGYTDNSGGSKYDPEAAKKQLDEAGWKSEGGTRTKDGKQLVVNYSLLTGVPTSDNEGQLFKQDMEKIGVKVNFVNTPPDDMSKVLTSHSFDTISFTWQGTPYPMANVRQIYGAKAEGSKQPSEANYSQLIDPRIEKLIPQVDTEMDVKKRQELANEADKAIWDDVMTLPLYRRIKFTGVPKNLANMGAYTFQTTRAEDIGYLK